MIKNIDILKNSSIHLREDDHKYLLGDIEFDSVTTIMSKQFNPFDADAIATKLVTTHPKYQSMTKEELLLDWEIRRDAGTAVHEELEEYILNKTYPKWKKSVAGAKWIDTQLKNFGDTYFPEIIVFSEKHKIAGTIDLLVHDSKTNNCYIFDWKTSAKIDMIGRESGITTASSNLTNCKFDQYSLQLSAYSYLLNNYHNILVKDTYIVHLMEDCAKCIKARNLETNIESIFKEITSC